jgi:hypothetical protein
MRVMRGSRATRTGMTGMTHGPLNMTLKLSGHGIMYTRAYDEMTCPSDTAILPSCRICDAPTAAQPMR